MTAPKRDSSRARQAALTERMRAAGLIPVQVWVRPERKAAAMALDERATASPATVRDALASGAEYRRQRLAAADIISTDEAAALLGTSRVTICAWIASGRCIGLTQARRGFRVPRWQFEPQVWPHIARISEARGTVVGWALLEWLEAPHGGLGGLSPRQALERGAIRPSFVIALAGE